MQTVPMQAGRVPERVQGPGRHGEDGPLAGSRKNSTHAQSSIKGKFIRKGVAPHTERGLLSEAERDPGVQGTESVSLQFPFPLMWPDSEEESGTGQNL